MQSVFFEGEAHAHRQYCLSQQLASQIGAQRGQCYLNSASCIKLLSDLSALRYVEGWVSTPDGGGEPILLIEHAWLHLEGWGVIDPSIIFWQSMPGFGESRYFAGLSYTFAQLLTHSPDNLPAAHVQSSLPAGMGLASYRQAYAYAYHHAEVCAQRTSAKEIRIMPSHPPGDEEPLLIIAVRLSADSILAGLQEEP